MRMLGLLLVSTTVTLGGPKPGDEGTPEFEKASALVKQLGHPRFAVRETAAKQLLDLGGAAVPALLAGTKSDDEEVRSRSVTLLPQAKAADWRRRAEAYLADAEGKQKHDLPLLAEWEKVTGKPDDGSRKLFADMIRTSGEFLSQVAASNVPSNYTGEQARLLLDRVRTGKGQIKAEPGELAAVLFADVAATDIVGARPPGRGRHAAATPAQILSNPSWPEAIGAADVGPPVRKLLVRWADTRLPRGSDGWQHFADLARKKPFAEAAPVLIKAAKDKQADVLGVRLMAVDALGKVGGQEATAALTGLVTDRTNVFGGGGDVDHLLGDQALAALVHLTGKKLNDYGLTNNVGIGFATGDGDETISLSLYGFASAEARKKGLQKWQDEQKNVEPKKQGR
jgi:hypothetical protein